MQFRTSERKESCSLPDCLDKPQHPILVLDAWRGFDPAGDIDPPRPDNRNRLGDVFWGETPREDQRNSRVKSGQKFPRSEVAGSSHLTFDMGIHENRCWRATSSPGGGNKLPDVVEPRSILDPKGCDLCEREGVLVGWVFVVCLDPAKAELVGHRAHLPQRHPDENPDRSSEWRQRPNDRGGLVRVDVAGRLRIEIQTDRVRPTVRREPGVFGRGDAADFDPDLSHVRRLVAGAVGENGDHRAFGRIRRPARKSREFHRPRSVLAVR